jgi:hypothetical protein
VTLPNLPRNIPASGHALPTRRADGFPITASTCEAAVGWRLALASRLCGNACGQIKPVRSLLPPSFRNQQPPHSVASICLASLFLLRPWPQRDGPDGPRCRERPVLPWQFSQGFAPHAGQRTASNGRGIRLTSFMPE